MLLGGQTLDLQEVDRAAWAFIVKNADHQPAGSPSQGIEICPPLPDERPACIRIMPMHDIAAPVTGVEIFWVPAPKQGFLVLQIERNLGINCRMDEDPVLVDVKNGQVG